MTARLPQAVLHTVRNITQVFLGQPSSCWCVYPVLQSGLFYVAAALFAVVLVLTPVWFPRAQPAS